MVRAARTRQHRSLDCHSRALCGARRIAGAALSGQSARIVRPDCGRGRRLKEQPMQLRFVGCGDAFGSGGRNNTCFHVSGESVNFLIDCGASSLPALKRQNVARDEIELILITHFHGDHFARPAVSAAGRAIHPPHPAAGDRGAGRNRDAADTGDGSDVREFVEDQTALRSRRSSRWRPEKQRSSSARSASRRFRWCMANPAVRFWATGSRPKAASSPTAPTPNGPRR